MRVLGGFWCCFYNISKIVFVVFDIISFRICLLKRCIVSNLYFVVFIESLELCTERDLDLNYDYNLGSICWRDGVHT